MVSIVRMDQALNKYVNVRNGVGGIIRYVGSVDGKDGIWAGVELNVPKGTNDGSVNNQRYFTCQPGYGLFVRCKRMGSQEHESPAENDDKHSIDDSNVSFYIKDRSNKNKSQNSNFDSHNNGFVDINTNSLTNKNGFSLQANAYIPNSLTSVYQTFETNQSIFDEHAQSDYKLKDSNNKYNNYDKDDKNLNNKYNIYDKYKDSDYRYSTTENKFYNYKSKCDDPENKFGINHNNLKSSTPASLSSELENKILKNENNEYKKLINHFTESTKTTIKSIQSKIDDLAFRIARISKFKVKRSEREEVAFLAAKICEENKKGNSEAVKELITKFNGIVGKYRIKIE